MITILHEVNTLFVFLSKCPLKLEHSFYKRWDALLFNVPLISCGNLRRRQDIKYHKLCVQWPSWTHYDCVYNLKCLKKEEN